MGKDLRGKELGTGISQRKDGLYTARYTDINGNRQQRYFKTLKECKSWLNEKIYEKEHCMLKNSDMLFRYWLDIWFEYKTKSVRMTTQKYNKLIKERLEQEFGNYPIGEIKPIDIQRFMEQFENYKIGTLKLYLTVVHNVFEYAVINDVINKNPCNRSVVINGEDGEAKKSLTVYEQKALIKGLNRTKYKDVFLLILQTGMRIGEVLALQWNDVDFEERQIYVKRTAVFVDNIRYINKPKTKSGERMIPMTEEAYEILKRLKSDNIKSITVFDSNYNYYNINMCLKNCSHKIIGKKISTHILRHTFATRCIEAGMTPKVLQTILGHSSLAMTMDLYVDSTEEYKKEEMQKIQKMLKTS